MFRNPISVLVWLLLLAVTGEAQETRPKKQEKPATKKESVVPSQAQLPSAKSVEQIAQQVKPSLVVISLIGRDGKDYGVGTGFVISSDGLIATNLHVIGEARRFRVELADGRKPPVLAVHASDRDLDLAILKVDAKDLPALPLGDSGKLKLGTPIVVMGNPQGLKESVVSGVVSAKRKVEGREMIQLAVPVEPGNSGGPVVDRVGRVQGIMTMKSVVTNNLGFAVAVNLLKPLVQRPNPVPMAKWQTIGTIDSQRWKTLFGGSWQQRGGRILVDGQGQGFGGRMLCLWQTPLPKVPYEVAVRVVMDDEAGAAGLVFRADGHDRHYGFYPSGGNLRLTRFDGPNVLTWKVLRDEPSSHYRAGKFNHLKVRVEKDRFLCYVNDHLVYESKDSQLTSGKVGLAKFRNTKATFKQFQIGSKLPASTISVEQREAIEKLIDALPPLERAQTKNLEPLLAEANPSRQLLLDRAETLEKKAAELRRIAADVHVQSLVAELKKLSHGKDDFDMLKASLLVAKLNDEEIDIGAYAGLINRMVTAVRKRVAEDADEAARLKALDQYLFAEQGYHGSRFDYYHRANSFMNRVLDDRVGLPITLSILYIELARRLNVNVEGVGLPGHFVVRFVPRQGKPQLIDVFNEAKRLSRKQAAEVVWQHSGQLLRDEHLSKLSSRQVMLRVLRNLISLAQNQADRSELLRYLEMYVLLDPKSVPERGLRAMSRFETGRRQAAISDLDWILEERPEGLDLQRIHQLREYFKHREPPQRK